MAIDRLQALTEQYAQALEDYCLNPDRDGSLASALGEQAAAAGLTLIDLIQLHQQTLDTGLESVPTTQDGVILARRTAAFLAQSLVPLQQAALQERQQVETALQQLNTELESRVQARTAELAQKNAELEALFQIFPDSFFRVAADGTYLECRGQLEDFYLPPEEMIGRTVQEVLPSPIGHEFQATYQDVLRRNEQLNMEYALTIGGIEKYYEARFMPLQPDQVVAIVRNIGDRKMAEAALQASEQNLRTIFDTVNHELWVHDVHGNILDVNARVLELTGRDRAQMLQRSVLDDCFPSTHAMLRTYWQRALNGERIHFELQAPNPRSDTVLDLDITLNRIIRDGSAVLLATVQD
ncbi:MAG TPA: PAS domain-containing protein, partial [Crinalium sp.]